MRTFSANSQVRIVRSENDILKQISTKAETLRPVTIILCLKKEKNHDAFALQPVVEWSGVSGGLGLPRGPSDADLAPICQTVSDLRPARATRHRKSTALFSCFLLLPVSTVTASHPHISSLQSPLFYKPHCYMRPFIFFLKKPSSLIPLQNRQGSAFPSLISSSPIHALKLERDNNTLFVKNTDIKLVSYFSHHQ